MRYIAKVLKDTLHEKFPDSSDDDLLKVSVKHLTRTLYHLYCNYGVGQHWTTELHCLISV